MRRLDAVVRVADARHDTSVLEVQKAGPRRARRQRGGGRPTDQSWGVNTPLSWAGRSLSLQFLGAGAFSLGAHITGCSRLAGP